MILRICPKCHLAVEARHYLGKTPSAYRSSSQIHHDCGYYGLPLDMDEADYKKLKEKRSYEFR